MADLWLNGFRSVADCASRELIASPPSTEAYKWPIPAHPHQNLASLVTRATRVSDLPAAGEDLRILSPARLDMFTIQNGFFAAVPDHFGMVFTPGGEGIREACLFSAPSRQRITSVRIGEISDIVFDEVFISFDGGWTNWFHWICFALAKSAVAAEVVSPACRIVLPDWTPHSATSFSRAAWQQSLSAFGLADRVTLLPAGIYRARKLHLLWTDTERASDIIPFDRFAGVFQRLQHRLHVVSQTPKRIIVARDRDPRLNQAEQALLHDVAQAHGFALMRFETMDFAAQAGSLLNADLALGAHGAGLVNILFGREQLGVLEINRNLDGPGGAPRPWFYMLANSRRQRYMTLDADLGELTKQYLDAAIEVLTARV
jgi:hypothetical protein